MYSMIIWLEANSCSYLIAGKVPTWSPCSFLLKFYHDVSRTAWRWHKNILHRQLYDTRITHPSKFLLTGIWSSSVRHDGMLYSAGAVQVRPSGSDTWFPGLMPMCIWPESDIMELMLCTLSEARKPMNIVGNKFHEVFKIEITPILSKTRAQCQVRQTRDENGTKNQWSRSNSALLFGISDLQP